MFARWLVSLSRLAVVPAVLLALLGSAASAQAGTAQELEQLPVLDALTRAETPLSGSGTWSTLNWAANAGKDTTAGWGPSSAYSTVNGAFWNPVDFPGAEAVGAAMTMQVSPGGENRYEALWLDMPNPSAAKSGYQLRWTVNAGETTYAVKLLKWSSGTEAVLASGPSVSLPVGTRMEIADLGGTVEAWEVAGGVATRLLSVADGTYGGGYAGIEGSGNISRAVNFGAGPLIGRAVSGTQIRDSFERNEVPLATGKWSKSLWTAGIGGAWCCSGFRGFGSSGGLEGAYWNQSTFGDSGGGDLVAATVGTGSAAAGQYQSLWLNAPTPATATSGYEARFAGVNGATTNYKLELSRWDAGTRTVLTSKEGVSLAAGTTMALSESGGRIVAWTNYSGGEFLPLVSASDTTYRSGYAGIDVKGGSGTDYNFRAGSIGGLAPVVTTGAASAVKTAAATLSGTVNPSGTSTAYQFEYGTSTSYGSLSPTTPASAGAGSEAAPVGTTLSGLTAATTYHYRLVATNASGITKGADATFTTVGAPVVATEPATEAAATEATLNASVNPRGGATTYQFEYGKTTSYGSKVPATAGSAGSGTTPVAASEKATGLSEGTLYHYRVVATNEAGTVYGADKTVTTPFLPEATTETAERVNANEATLDGEVDSNGNPATYSFEYGTSTAYGSMAPSAGESAGQEGEADNAFDSIRNLEPETTYHYRVVAKSAAGTVKGVDRTFTTAARTKTPEEEALQKQQELSYDSSKDKHPLGSDYMGMMWSGDLNKMATEGVSQAVRHSGAKWLRLNFYPSYSEETLRKIIQTAANREIRILPYFGWGWPGAEGVKNVWAKEIAKWVERYGPNGTWWAENSGKDEPIEVWEIGNEPNLGANGPHPSSLLTAANLHEYGQWFSEASAAAKNAAANRGGSIRILLSGLFSTSPTGCSNNTPKECHTDVNDFIRGMGAENAYDGISLHPYVLALGPNHDKLTTEDAGRVKEIVHKKVVEAREALEKQGKANKNTAEENKKIWITELGWPTANEKTPGLSPPVSEATQRKLIETSFEMLKADHEELGIAHLFYYNIEDNPNTNEPGSEEKRNWDHFSGLLRPSGKEKEAWLAFTKVAHGNPEWPEHLLAKKEKESHLKPHGAQFNARVTTEGSGIVGRAQAWQPGPEPEVLNVGEAAFEGSESEELIGIEGRGLKPSTRYMSHVVVTNEQEKSAVTENEEFETPPSTSTSADIQRVLHGQPGYLWVNGWVKEGSINGEGSGPGLANVHVHIKLYRSGSNQPERFVDVTTNGEGRYESGYFQVGKGSWEARSEFPGGPELAVSESAPKPFSIRDGVRIRAQLPGGSCWDLFGAAQYNGAPMMSGSCNEPVTSNQVFELVPQGNGEYLQIKARNSGKCVDVDNASTADGTGLQQYDCLGAGQSNQLFREAWSGNWLSYVAKHSGKCVDVTGANTGWINLQQWTCNASPQQAFRLEPVESGPIPTESFLTVAPIIHGNGQYGNWGLATLSGHVLAGAYSMENRVARIQVQKAVNGQWTQTDELPLTVNSEGSYRFNDYGLAPGIFRMRAVFVGDGHFGGSESEWHQFAIWQANRLVARNSGKCLSLSNAAHENFNGQHFVQWDCSSSPSFSDGQTFWFWPVGNNNYEITVIGTGKCLDVALGGENGARLQQWDCTHAANQRFQVLEIAGQPGWYAIRPTHQYRCLDVVGGTGATGNGPEIDQWDCTWASNQQWEIQGVIAG